MATLAEGSDSRADMENVPYSFKRWRIVENIPENTVDNSEGKAGDPSIATLSPGKGSRLPGNRTVTVEIEEATFDADDNIFDGPVDINGKSWLTVKIYPFGREADYHLIHFLVTSVEHSGEVGGLQPVSIRGTSDGDYLLYGEAKA